MIFLIHHQALTANLVWVDKSDHRIISRIMFPFSKLPVETYWGFLLFFKFFSRFKYLLEFVVQNSSYREVRAMKY